MKKKQAAPDPYDFTRTILLAKLPQDKVIGQLTRRDVRVAERELEKYQLRLIQWVIEGSRV